MPRPREINESIHKIGQPSYEQELRACAMWLKCKADGVGGIPTVCVQISPDFAKWIADRLDNHADDVENNRG